MCALSWKLDEKKTIHLKSLSICACCPNRSVECYFFTDFIGNSEQKCGIF